MSQLTKRPRGRPPKPPAERQVYQAGIRLTDAVLAAVESARGEKSISDWIREAIELKLRVERRR